MRRSESGQGFIEYAMILILVVVIVVIMVALLKPAMDHASDPSFVATLNASVSATNAANQFAYKQRQIDACMSSERYTLEQCIQIVGQQ